MRQTGGGSRRHAEIAIDRVAKAALSSDPGKVVQYIAWDKDEPDR